VSIPIGYVDAWMRMTMAGDPEPMWTSLGWRIQEPPFTQQNALALMQGMALTMTDTCSNQITYTGGVARVGNDGEDIVFDVSFNLPGNIAGAPLPNNCAVLVKKQTQLGGRRGRGRMFIPGITAAQVTGSGVIDVGTLTSWQSMVTELFLGSPDNAPANVVEPVLFHRLPTTSDLPPTPIVGLAVDGRIATQRRRLR
jgi:hypothetical protein